MNIAIVGSGISGLVCAYLLHRKHRVAVFEGADYIGGHTHTVDVPSGDSLHAVDTGFIVFNRRHYPNFSKLLSRLDVVSQPTSMSFSVRCDRTGLEYNGTSLNTLFSQRRNLVRPRFWRMLRDIVKFGKAAPRLLQTMKDDVSVDDYLRESHYCREFGEHYLVPLGASLWSSPSESFRSFPMRFVIEFLHNHSMLQVSGRPTWEVIRGGSRTYVDRITESFRNSIRLRSPVDSIRRRAEKVEVRALGRREEFDHVILACHADQALRLLSDPSQEESKILAAFPYQQNDVVLHTDAQQLPVSRRAWAAWNYRLTNRSSRSATVTYNMNILQTLRAKETFCVTLNGANGIDTQRVQGRFQYEHPQFTAGRSAAQARHAELINHRRTSYCGAYWGYGFHEDGVNSALAVCAAFGQRL